MSKESKPGMKTILCREGCGNKMEVSKEATAGMCYRCLGLYGGACPAGRLEYVSEDALMKTSDSDEDDSDGDMTVSDESWND